eukprot:6544203-Prorocentrum_lima.AAC.1
MKRPTCISRKQQRSGHHMKDGCNSSDLYNATDGTHMFQSKVAERILLGCGRGSLHPELLLELLL